jgi:ankyrin repeat protein
VDEPEELLPQRLNAGRLEDEDSEWRIFSGLRGMAKADLVKLLLAYGANPNERALRLPSFSEWKSRGALNATPFWIAARAGDAEMMRLLLANGADPTTATSRNVTPLMVAAGVTRGTGDNPVPEHRALEAVKVCLTSGNDVNARNVNGETALHGAVYRGAQGSEGIIRALVDHGARVNVKNKEGWTPLTIAEGIYTGNNNTVSLGAAELLRTLGAEPSPSNVNRNVGSRPAGAQLNQ